MAKSLSGSEDGTAIRAVGLSKSYGSAAAPVHALRAVSFQVRQGERVALLGKSGSGKSTLLNLLGALDHPTSGGLKVDGWDLDQLSSGQLARFRTTSVGMIFQSFNLVPSRTAAENVELPMVFAGRSPAERRELARQALEDVGLVNRMRHYPAELSGGEMQRVAIARALVNRPAVVLADEPTGNLDSQTARDIMQFIVRHVEANSATLVMVTHDEDLAAECTERVLRLKDGDLEH